MSNAQLCTSEVFGMHEENKTLAKPHEDEFTEAGKIFRKKGNLLSVLC